MDYTRPPSPSYRGVKHDFGVHRILPQAVQVPFAFNQLVNATPIRSEEGEVESVVVTLQDMTPLEDLERLRAEFLGMG